MSDIIQMTPEHHKRELLSGSLKYIIYTIILPYKFAI